MSNKLKALIVGVVASLALAAGTMQGCGSDNGGGSNVALCERACDKVLMCTPDAGTAGEQARTMCKQNCATQVPTTHCTNESAIASAVNSCLDMSCETYITCLATVPDCQGGTGGTSGGGGTTGTGGTGGGASCDLCTKADSCCVAVGGTTQQCVLAQTCSAANAETRASVVIACQGVLDQARMLSNPPAACQ